MIADPSPCATNTGSTPTDRHARTGELTPPGITCFARWKIAWLFGLDIGANVAYADAARSRDRNNTASATSATAPTPITTQRQGAFPHTSARSHTGKIADTAMSLEPTRMMNGWRSPSQVRSLPLNITA